MWLDAALASLALLAAAMAIMLADDESAALRITLYWIRTLHGLGSLPYVLFRLPGAMPLLTHARRTGYDSLGHTVPFRDNSTYLSGPPPSAAGRGSGEHGPVARRLFAEEPLAERGGGLRWAEWSSWQGWRDLARSWLRSSSARRGADGAPRHQNQCRLS
jgi:hypothetical protein